MPRKKSKPQPPPEGAKPPSKSAAIREYRKEYPQLTAAEVAAAVGAQLGTSVSAALVHQIDAKKNPPAVTTQPRNKVRRRQSVSDPYRPLIQARHMAEQLGGIDKARSALDALDKILA